MDFGAGAGRLRPFPREHGADLLEADGCGDERPRIDRTTRVRRNGGVQTGEPDKTPTAVASLRAKVRVSMWLGLPARPI
jgi:hypothetical protein